MAPGAKSESSDDDEAKPQGANTSAAEAALKARLSRKRTKTGCLTCRKRRIKCGEERPVCRNCIKSKRHCEGYNQRVVFKPTFDFHPVAHGGAHITFHAGPGPGPTAPCHPDFIHAGNNYAIHSQLRPRPPEHYEHTPQHVIPFQPAPPAPQQPPYVNHGPPDAGYAMAAPPPNDTLVFQPQQPDFNPNVIYQQSLEVSSNQQPAHDTYTYYVEPPSGPCPSLPMDTPREAAHLMPGSDGRPVRAPDQPLNFPRNDVQWISETPGASKRKRSTTLSPEASHTEALYVHSQATVLPPHPPRARGYVPRPELSHPIDYQPPAAAVSFDVHPPPASIAPMPAAIPYSTPDFWDYELHVPPYESPTYVLNQAAVEVHDDDYYDVHSDEEMDIDTAALVSTDHDRQRTLSRILHGNHISIQEVQRRRYDTFLFDGMLDKYRVEEHANPLRNPATARVFAHFISVTGPSLSIFERHPRNTSVLFTPGHIPFSQQGLWTYAMPMAALHHQGLLHAMLALASLHIARLKGASATPSMQHYAWALKRVHDCVGNPKKRLKITTIAASMLLGFYEIMTADHMKWNTHLLGAKQLFVETDFVTMTQQFRRMKMERAARHHFGQKRPSESPPGFSQDDLLEEIPDVDERIISDLVGREVRYGDHGQVMTPQSSMPQELDLSKFEILKDLYWWYCKQDAYQSIVSGNPLLMDFSRWSNCPPRAPLGKAEAVYGSFDHLILLLARIAEFAARDRERKLKQMELNGGQWRPAPGMKVPRPPQPPAPSTPLSANGAPLMHGHQHFQTQPPPPQQAPPAQPMFFGMAPPPRQNVQMPYSYGPLNGTPTPQSATPQVPFDIQIATQTALEDYGRIRAALLQFASKLGDAFQPLTPEEQPPLETSFGAAVFYRAFDIGSLWAVYHMAMIIAIRSHPHMPPAAHMAAGVAAQETAYHANEIGRIVAGIVPSSSEHSLNPSLGAALCESCMPSFFAAVQYQDPRQRHETVTRIFAIARQTGWGSAELIANGCETAWVKAAAAGRGPPYTRVVRPQYSDDPRLNGSWENLDPRSMPDEKDDGDRRLIKMRAQARLNWAIGIMGTEEDIALSH